jgi:hypothetical protein
LVAELPGVVPPEVALPFPALLLEPLPAPVSPLVDVPVLSPLDGEPVVFAGEGERDGPLPDVVEPDPARA